MNKVQSTQKVNRPLNCKENELRLEIDQNLILNRKNKKHP